MPLFEQYLQMQWTKKLIMDKEFNLSIIYYLFDQVFKVQSKEDGKLYAIKKSRDPFRGESDR